MRACVRVRACARAGGRACACVLAYAGCRVQECSGARGLPRLQELDEANGFLEEVLLDVPKLFDKGGALFGGGAVLPREGRVYDNRRSVEL